MGAERITGFGGLAPKVAARQLPGQAARAADNCVILSGELKPLRKNTVAWEPAAPTGLGSFFRASDSLWFGWPQEFVQMQTAPLEGEARYLFTGDGVPKVTTAALGAPVAATGEPAAARSLGVPTPTVAPTVVPSGGSGAAESRFYVYTFYSDWDEESSPSPPSALATGKEDGTFTLSNMQTAPPNSGSVSGAVHAAGVVTVTVAAAHFLRPGDEVSLSGVGGMTDLNGAFVVLSAPTPTIFTVALSTAQTYSSGGTWVRIAPWGACTKRIYRTTGSTGDFQLVADGVTGTSYVDSALVANILGDSLVSDGWAPPPPDMEGLTALSNGVMAGFRRGGRTICLSEPYQPHAWPEAYQIRVPDVVVTLTAYDTTLVALTAGPPVVISGVEPGQVVPVRHPKPMPCLSRAGACSVSDAAIYVSKLGLVRVDLSGAALFTDALFSAEDWDALSPATMRLAYDGQNVIMSTTVGKRLWLLDTTAAGGGLTTATQAAECIRLDEANGNVYLSDGSAVYRFNDPAAAPRSMDWWSREFVVGKPMNIGAAKVETLAAYSAQAEARIAQERADTQADNAAKIAAGSVRGAFNARPYNVVEFAGSDLQALPSGSVATSFSLYVGDSLIFSATVPDGKAFRLPAGYRADAFSVRVQSNTQVRAIVFGDTPGALAQA